MLEAGGQGCGRGRVRGRVCIANLTTSLKHGGDDVRRTVVAWCHLTYYNVRAFGHRREKKNWRITVTISPPGPPAYLLGWRPARHQRSLSKAREWTVMREMFGPARAIDSCSIWYSQCKYWQPFLMLVAVLRRILARRAFGNGRALATAYLPAYPRYPQWLTSALNKACVNAPVFPSSPLLCPPPRSWCVSGSKPSRGGEQTWHGANAWRRWAAGGIAVVKRQRNMA